MQDRQSVSPYTGSACLVLVGALIAHFVFMVAGIPWLRTAAFAVGTIGNLIILGQILYH